MEWFKEKWLEKDHTALGVYLMLLWLKFCLKSNYMHREHFLNDFKSIYGCRSRLSEIIIRSFSIKGKEFKETMDVVDEFVRSIPEPEKYINREMIAEEIEQKYYPRFKEVWLKYVKKEQLKDGIRNVQNFLWNLKAKLYGDYTTAAGSLCIHDIHIIEFEKYEEDVESLPAFFRRILKANLAIPCYIYVYDSPFDMKEKRIRTLIFPAPVLEDEFIESLREELSEKKEEVIEVPDIEGAVMTKVEIGKTLEECVKNVFEQLKFDVSKKVKIRGKGGVEHEIDVLARKDLEGVTFRIGVECKNWKNTVGKDVVERYVTRWLESGLNMYIIIAKGFTEDAKRLAEAWGIMPIELGEQAREDNLEQITNILMRKFSGLVIGIAKQPLIDSILGRINQMNNELDNLRNRLNELTKGLSDLANEVKKLLT